MGKWTPPKPLPSSSGEFVSETPVTEKLIVPDSQAEPTPLQHRPPRTHTDSEVPPAQSAQTDAAEKVLRLKRMFPEKLHDEVWHVLMLAGGNVDKAIDLFFDSSPEPPQMQRPRYMVIEPEITSSDSSDEYEYFKVLPEDVRELALVYPSIGESVIKNALLLYGKDQAEDMLFHSPHKVPTDLQFEQQRRERELKKRQIIVIEDEDSPVQNLPRKRNRIVDSDDEEGDNDDDEQNSDIANKKTRHMVETTTEDEAENVSVKSANRDSPSRNATIVLSSDEEDGSASGDGDASSSDEDEPDYEYVKDFFNSAIDEELMDYANCSAKMLELVKKKRPFKSYTHLSDIVETTKGLRFKMIEDYIEARYALDVLDQVTTECTSISETLVTSIKSFSDAGELDRASPTANDNSNGDDDDEEAGLHLVELNLQNQQDGNETVIRRQPKSINPKLQLKEYQILGLNWLWLLHRMDLSGILADEMGLGKTAQVISFIAHLVETGIEGSFLIVVPASVIQNWSREFQKWCPSLLVHSYHGSQTERAALRTRIYNTRYHVLLTTYTMVNTKEDRSFLRKSNFLYLILDEGHMIKNIQSQRAQNLMQIKTQHRLLLTGTPLQNNLQELLSLLIFIMPRLFQDREDDLRRVFTFKRETSLTQERIRRAKVMLNPFILRRKKVQVLRDLPKKIEHVLRCDTTPVHREAYRKLLLSSRKVSAELNEQGSTQLQNILVHLRKLSLHPLLSSGRLSAFYPEASRKAIADILFRKTEYYSWAEGTKKDKAAKERDVFEDVMGMMDYEIAFICNDYKVLDKYRVPDDVWMQSGKINILLRILKHHGDLEHDTKLLSTVFDDRHPTHAVKLAKRRGEPEKILVFSQFVMMLNILQHILTKVGIRFVRLDGSMPTMDRQKVIDEFEKNDEVRVFLLSTRAGGFGINLTAASVVVLFDLDFNPFNDAQAEDRAHRVGQTRDVTVYKLLTTETIEERIFEMAQAKISLDRSISSVTRAAVNAVGENETGNSGSGNSKKEGEDVPLPIDNETVLSVLLAELNRA